MPAVRSVVITGASTGIGRGCALRMDALGWRVFAGVRKEVDANHSGRGVRAPDATFPGCFRWRRS
jgi:NAD(P)-dependent dehydrogenase (short-subunit alcohol dehydrogenase family)